MGSGNNPRKSPEVGNRPGPGCTVGPSFYSPHFGGPQFHRVGVPKGLFNPITFAPLINTLVGALGVTLQGVIIFPLLGAYFSPGGLIFLRGLRRQVSLYISLRRGSQAWGFPPERGTNFPLSVSAPFALPGDFWALF